MNPPHSISTIEASRELFDTFLSIGKNYTSVIITFGETVQIYWIMEFRLSGTYQSESSTGYLRASNTVAPYKPTLN